MELREVNYLSRRECLAVLSLTGSIASSVVTQTNTVVAQAGNLLQ